MEMHWIWVYINLMGMIAMGGERVEVDVDVTVFEADKQDLALKSKRICVERSGRFGQA
jgi:hypothetical protein